MRISDWSSDVCSSDLYKNAQGQDSDFNTLDILRRTDLDRRFRLFPQELRLQGEAFDGRLGWLVGGYYAHEKLDGGDDIVCGADYQRYANYTEAEALDRKSVVEGQGVSQRVNLGAGRVINHK